MDRKDFREIDKQLLPAYYNSDSDTISQFLVPVLKRTMRYRRMTYSFSSAILTLIQEALTDLIKNECKIEYIVGFEIEPDDVLAIKDGVEDELKFIEKQIQIEFGSVEKLIEKLGNRYNPDIYKHRLKALSFLISEGILDIRVGFVQKNGRIVNPERFKFHPKVMIFEDFHSNIIVGNGSTNESLGGHVLNEETFDVFKSWHDSNHEHLTIHLKKFDEFWNGGSSRVRTIPVGELVKEKVLAKYRPDFHNKNSIIEMEEKLNAIARKIDEQGDSAGVITHVTLRPYQDLFLQNWFGAKNRGIMQFATGAGKTLTAIHGMKRLSAKVGHLAVVIVTPYRALTEQWAAEVARHAPEFYSTIAYENKNDWNQPVAELINAYNIGIKNRICIATTLATFARDEFQRVLKSVEKDLLLVVDEVHHFGSKGYEHCMTENAAYRLGLSATPERYEDDAGSNRLLRYFGEPLEPILGLKEAFDLEVLNRYHYHPVIVELLPDEQGNYRKVSSQLQSIWEQSATTEQFEENISGLLDLRAGILNTASQKIVVLRQLIEKRSDCKNTLVYCQDMQHLENVASVLFDLGVSTARITSREVDYEDRRSALALFKEGKRQMLLAINCLDEGIDLPMVNGAYILASSSNPRQFIQRRGRVLRVLRDDQGRPLPKRVDIFDFMVFPPVDPGQNPLEFELYILQKELGRFKEFAELAINREEAEGIVEEYLKSKGLRGI